jgi:hypothetical protein
MSLKPASWFSCVSHRPLWRVQEVRWDKGGAEPAGIIHFAMEVGY